VEHLVANAAKAHDKLAWRRRVDFSGLVCMMVEADITLLKT
jgi:GDP-D-mannose dehydratase